MRCPRCGSESPPAQTRCGRCEAPLYGPADEGTTPDAPPPTPWAEPPEEADWPTPPPDLTPWGSPPSRSGETHVSLGHEPWEQEPDGQWRQGMDAPWQEHGGGPPWQPEPEIWQPPPPPPRRQLLPYVVAGLAVVVLAAVAVGIVFWPTGGNEPVTTSGNSTVPAQSPSAPPETSGSPSQEPTGGAFDEQARKVNTLLDEMASTRTQLGSVVAEECDTSGLERVRGQRRSQLAQARTLQVDSLENGTRLRDALVRALEASVESNQRYLDQAPGCPPDSAVYDINSRAQEAKRQVVDYWGPNAQKASLPSRDANTI
jgi:hypothetical protein